MLSEAPSSIFWLMFLPDATGQLVEAEDYTNLVGLIGMNFREEMPHPDMGYVVTQAHGGHGYAAEGGKQVLSYWRDLVGVKEIFIGSPVDNIPSQRCAERIGLVRGGTLFVEGGKSPNVELEASIAYVLPGMQWQDGLIAKYGRGWSEE